MRKQLVPCFAVVTLCLVGACSKKDAAKGDDKKKPAAPTSVDVSAANAAIPEKWKGKLELVSTKVGDKNDAVIVAAPKGWKKGFLPGSFEPADSSAGFGFATKFSAGTTCGGLCESQTAAALEKAADKSFFANVYAHTPPPKVAKDEKKPGRRTMIATDANEPQKQGNVTVTQTNMTYVIVATWNDGDERFTYCNVDLAPESADLAPAFEKACETIVPAD